MGRLRRPHLPGAAFHITARVQNGAQLLRGLEDFAANAIIGSAASAGVRPLAYAVMPNHLHLVAIQGDQPLGWFMHPLLRRLALAVRRTYGGEGHVFGRRYFSVPCLDAEYLRTAIVYVHLNPVRAALCDEAADYAWSSHREYVATPPVASNAQAMLWEHGLRLFAESSCSSPAAVRASYLAVLQARRCADLQMVLDGKTHFTLLPTHPCRGGDEYWRAHFLASAAVAGNPTARSCSEDLGDIVHRTILEYAPDLKLSLLRLPMRTPAAVKVRRVSIERALTAGYSPGQIARYLRISQSTVSKVSVALRNDAAALTSPRNEPGGPRE